jgi:hypothetical protein
MLMYMPVCVSHVYLPHVCLYPVCLPIYLCVHDKSRSLRGLLVIVCDISSVSVLTVSMHACYY